MKIANVGDLVQSTMLRRDTSRVKADLDRLTSEMTSGRVASLNSELRGQFGPLSGITRSLALADAMLASNGTAGRLAEAQQLALGAVQNTADAAGPAFLEATSTGNEVQRKVLAEKATGQFQQVLSALNTRIEDKAIFAGAALDGPALADAEGILADLEVALAGTIGPADAIATVADWFNSPGGGFERVAYLGAATPMSDIVIASGETVSLDITANDQALRDTLRGLALGALIDRGLFDGDGEAQKEAMKHAGETLVAAADAVTTRRAGLGFTEERIEAARIRTDAETIGLNMAQSALVEADPYETALRLQETQVQLETIYALTARLSKLSLAMVLR
jgi:flagellar hook-associated protein 3 FlgL